MQDTGKTLVTLFDSVVRWVMNIVGRFTSGKADYKWILAIGGLFIAAKVLPGMLGKGKR